MTQTEQTTATIISQRAAQRVAGYLAVNAVGFQMEPLPFDAYKFTVRQGDAGHLARAGIADQSCPLVMTNSQADTLLKTAISCFIQFDETSENPITDATTKTLRWYEESAFPPVACATTSTPHVVTCIGGGTEFVYINVVQGNNGWYFTNALGGTDGIFGIHYEDVGPYKSEGDALYAALNLATTYALENDYPAVSVTEQLGQDHYWPAKEWARIEDTESRIYRRI